MSYVYTVFTIFTTGERGLHFSAMRADIFIYKSNKSA